MLQISRQVFIPDNEIELNAIRSQGAGGQNINKVSTAVHLRFDIHSSSLPQVYKEKLLKTNDRRISKEGIVVIKAQKHRTLEKNKEEALVRLQHLIRSAIIEKKTRKPTKPSKASKQRRLDSKTRHGQLKASRKKIDPRA